MLVTVLENNTEVKERLEKYVLPETVYFHVNSDVVAQGEHLATSVHV